VEAGYFGEDVVDVAMTAQFRDDTEVADDRAVGIAVRHGQSGEPAVRGIGEPPPLALTRHAAVEVHVLPGLPISPERGDVRAGSAVKAADGDPAQHGEEQFVVGFWPEGQPSAGIR
jgi:hypothetical protein